MRQELFLESNPLVQVTLGLVHELVPTLANIAQGLRGTPEVPRLIRDSVRARSLIVVRKDEASTVLGGVGLELHAPIVVRPKEYARKKMRKPNRRKPLLHKDLRTARPRPALNPCRART